MSHITVISKSVLLRIFLIIVIVIGLTGVVPRTARATAIFIVDNPADNALSGDINKGDGICAIAAGGGCTLRAAIEEANALFGADVITFASSMHILLASILPFIGDQLQIDGSTVWDSAQNRPGVILDGVDKSFLYGLGIVIDSCEVYGLEIRNFQTGILIASSLNTVGGVNGGQRNLISGNDYGIFIDGENADGNNVLGNWIGLSASGDSKDPNEHHGVYIQNGADSNTIGGPTPNIISGNKGTGVSVFGSGSVGNTIYNNWIGLPASGDNSVGNSSAGILVSGALNTIIGIIGYGNKIAGNDGEGIQLSFASFTVVQSNEIYNNKYGVTIVSGGSNNSVLNNLIYDNQKAGSIINGGIVVRIATHNQILNNSIFNHSTLGIDLNTGGNDMLAAPTITGFDSTGIFGQACSGCLVQVFSDAADEGKVFLGEAYADYAGSWSLLATAIGPNLTATNTDSDLNTSEFSIPYPISNIFLPLVQR